VSETAQFERVMIGDRPDFSAWARQYFGGYKRAEVLMAAANPKGEIWVHQKRDNPGGVWRLPTGKLEPGEDADGALPREVMEEFGTTLPVLKTLGVLEVRAEGVEESFLSHYYLLEASDITPEPLDESEGLDDFRAVSPADLRALATALRSLPPSPDFGWRDVYWGHFRALEHDLLADLLLRPGETPARAEEKIPSNFR
jgi:8-oxo-dGTP pyrophosphatase MutT (NUDIX family)